MDEDLRKCLLVEIGKYTNKFKNRIPDTEKSVDKIVGYKKFIYPNYVPEIIFKNKNLNENDYYPAILIDNKLTDNAYPIGCDLGSNFQFNESIFAVDNDFNINVYNFEKGDKLFIYGTLNKKEDMTNEAHINSVIEQFPSLNKLEKYMPSKVSAFNALKIVANKTNKLISNNNINHLSAVIFSVKTNKYYNFGIIPGDSKIKNY